MPVSIRVKTDGTYPPVGDSYLVCDLELLALADVGGLGHSGLKSVQGLVVQRLCAQDTVSIVFTLREIVQSVVPPPPSLNPILHIVESSYIPSRLG